MKATKPLIETLRTLIRDSGESQNQIASACEIDRANLSSFLRGERSISIETAEKICGYLGLELVKRK